MYRRGFHPGGRLWGLKIPPTTGTARGNFGGIGECFKCDRVSRVSHGSAVEAGAEDIVGSDGCADGTKPSLGSVEIQSVSKEIKSFVSTCEEWPAHRVNLALLKTQPSALSKLDQLKQLLAAKRNIDHQKFYQMALAVFESPPEDEKDKDGGGKRLRLDDASSLVAIMLAEHPRDKKIDSSIVSSWRQNREWFEASVHGVCVCLVRPTWLTETGYSSLVVAAPLGELALGLGDVARSSSAVGMHWSDELGIYFSRASGQLYPECDGQWCDEIWDWTPKV